MEQNRCPGCMEIKSGTVCGHCGYDERRQNAPHQLQIGTVLLGKYLVGRALGQGGFGITYLGWNRYLETRVAIKEYYPSVFVERNATQNTTVVCRTEQLEEYYAENRMRFLREAKTLAKLQNVPQIVSIHDFFEMNNTAYIVMEYLQGSDLRSYVRDKGGHLSPEETFRILRPAMAALAEVHEADLVHRDISPDNIMLLRDGSVKLMDFGAVRNVNNPGVDKELTQATQAIVKHGFAPIEQYSAKGSIGPWTDEYALCATMYYCMTGRVPENATDRIDGETELDWERIPGLTEYQQQVLRKGSAIRARDRYATVRELMDALFTRTAPMPQPGPRPTTSIPQPIAPTDNLPPLMKRVFLFLEDGEWDRADSFCEQMLNLNPECAEAYLGKLMVELRVRRREELRNCAEPFDGHNYYQKALRFAGPELQNELTGDIGHINTRNEKARKDAIYQKAFSRLKAAKAIEDFDMAAVLFESIPDYRDAAELGAHCRQKAADAGTDAIYDKAKQLMDRGDLSGYQEAITWFETIPNWRDSVDQTAACMLKIAELEKQKERQQEISATRDKRHGRLTVIAAVLVAAFIALIVFFVSVIYPALQYNKAVSLLDSGNYDEAIPILIDLDGYRDSTELMLEKNHPGDEMKLREAKYNYAKAHLFPNDLHTHAYLKELKALKYKDSAKLFDDLYRWRAELVYANSGANDHTTTDYSVNKRPTYFHFTFFLNGGEPGETAEFYHRVIWPDGSVYVAEWCWTDCVSGSSLGAEWSQGFTTTSGTMVIEIYKNGTNEQIGSFELKVK